jgi:hypothetical protein
MSTLTVTAIATDPAGNVTTKTASVTIGGPDGDLDVNGKVDIADALRALRIATGLIQPTATDMLHGDVSPLVKGVPAPDGKIDVSDALLILRKAVNLINF